MDCGEWSGDNGKEKESSDDHVLEETESFLLENDERLTVSRMLLGSLIKGMVNAFQQQAADRIARQELGVVKLSQMHESQLRKITEENSRLKEKDSDLLNAKIPDVISKLDQILVGNEKMHQFIENLEFHSSLKKFECLSSQLSAAVKESSQKKLAEENMLQTIRKLEDDIWDADAGVSAIQDVYKCLFEGITSEFRCTSEELFLKNSIVQEIYGIIFKETAQNVQASSRLEIEEAEMKSIMMQWQLDIHHIIFKEALVDANKAFKLEGDEKEELKQKMFMLTLIVEEKEKAAQEATNAFIQVEQKMELACKQLNSLRDKTVQQQKLIAENNKERQKKQEALTLIEAKQRETRKQMESAVDLIHKLSTIVAHFEAKVNEDIYINCLRLEYMSSEFNLLNNKANKLKTMGLMYKQKLEATCSDLAKAEAEVDLLGNDADTLHSLLERIYIALDHYSPILQHYPGIIQTLELVRRELMRRQSRKLV